MRHNRTDFHVTILAVTILSLMLGLVFDTLHDADLLSLDSIPEIIDRVLLRETKLFTY